MTATAEYEAEEYEITEDGRSFGSAQPLRSVKYSDGSTIDWLQQDAAERDRNQALRSQAGVRGVLSPIFEATRMWLVVIVTGMAIGLTGAWLDILVKWCAISFYCRCFGY
jgi:chloride channel 3/4/5